MKTLLILSSLWIFARVAFGDIVSYLRFEENGGPIAYDQTGLMDGEFNSHMPTEPGGGDTGFYGWSTNVPLATIPLTGAANNGSIRFAGGAEFIDLSNYNNLILGTSFTIEMFIKPDAVIGASVAFAFSDPFGRGFGFLLLEEQDGFMYGFDNGVEDLIFDERSPLLQIGVWQHIAIVKQPGTSRVYINGELAVQNDFFYDTTPYVLLGDATLGTRTLGGENGTWRGWIDEFRISDEALTPGQFLIAPEPSTFFLLGIGAVALALHSRRPCRQKRKGQPSAALLRLTRGGSTEGEP